MAASMAAAGANVVLNFNFYPPVRLYCGRLHDAGMLYAVFGRPLYCEQTDSGERRNPGKSDESRISSGVLRFSDWSKHHLQSDFPVQDPALRDSARKCRAGLLEERTSVEDDGGYPEKIKKVGEDLKRMFRDSPFFLDSHRKNDTMKE